MSALRRFKPYPAYKQSGVEWAGRLPDHWHLERAKYRFHRMQRPVRKTDEVVTAFRDGVVTLRARRRTEGFTLSDKEIGYQGVRVGDLVVHAMDGFAGAIGVSDSGGKATPVYSVLTPRRPTETQAHYYAYLLRHLAQSGFISSLAKGIRERSTEFRFAELKEIWLPVLPFAEQRDIAAFLDRETARIDALMAKKERLIGLLQEERTALITRAVTKGLDPTVPMRGSGTEWLGEIPAQWEVKRLRNVVARIEQGWSPDCENREADEDEWGVLKAGCVNRGAFLESEHKALPAGVTPIASLEIAEGDLLMSRASGSRDLVGSVAVVPKCRPQLLLCDKVFRLHPYVERADRNYLAYAMNSRVVRAQIEVAVSGGNGLANNIAQEVVKDLLFAQPQLPEQRTIVACLDRETARIEALVVKVREAIERLKELRTALISAAVTGKIDLREEVA